jgi:hypothetical protein
MVRWAAIVAAVVFAFVVHAAPTPPVHQLAMAQPVIPGCPNPASTCSRANFSQMDAGAVYVANNLGVGGLLYANIVDAGQLYVANDATVAGNLRAGVQTLHRGNSAVFSFGTQSSEQLGCAASTAVCDAANSLKFGIGAGTGATNGAELKFGGNRAVSSITVPTVAACSGGTAASITWAASTAVFQFDVGTACAGENTATITLPAATNGWSCDCWNTGAATNIRQSGGTTTSAVVTNYGTTVATAADWTDGADIRCMCFGG